MTREEHSTHSMLSEENNLDCSPLHLLLFIAALYNLGFLDPLSAYVLKFQSKTIVLCPLHSQLFPSPKSIWSSR